jgi:hypothetical protein
MIPFVMKRGNRFLGKAQFNHGKMGHIGIDDAASISPLKTQVYAPAQYILP